MLLSLFISTFITVFLAEMGDKTQIATIAISGTSLNPKAVFIGSAAALVMASLIGAIAGGSLSNLVPQGIIKLVAAVGFLIIGIRLVFQSLGKSQPNG